MIAVHKFIFSPGIWLGQGLISFSMSPEQLQFNTRWTISEEENDEISLQQEVEIHDAQDKMLNKFTLSAFQQDSFTVCLRNDILGKVTGKGVADEKIIAWEFRGTDLNFEGFEVFEKQDEEGYLTRAEFTSKDQMRTTIEGTIWKKLKDSAL